MSVRNSPPVFMHSGGCHCQAVTFSVRAPVAIEVLECNCSICARSGFLHLIVSAEDFVLTRGEKSLSHYTFNTGTADHQFCRVCGIKSFYVPRSHPHGYSVNARCLDTRMISEINIRKFDGLHWEESIVSLRN